MLEAIKDEYDIKLFVDVPLSVRAQTLFAAGEINGTDTALWVQTLNSKPVSLILKRYSSLTACLTRESDYAELLALAELLGSVHIIANTALPRDAIETSPSIFPLFRFSGEPNTVSDKAHTLNGSADTRIFRDIYSLVFPDGEHFDTWFSEFAVRLTKGYATGSYIIQDDRVVSVALAPFVFDGKMLISGVATAEDKRKSGLARSCLATLCTHSGKQSYLWCDSHLTEFYNSSGFYRTGTVFDYLIGDYSVQ